MKKQPAPKGLGFVRSKDDFIQILAVDFATDDSADKVT